ncbi:MAG: TetR/AcrR family transcriptional regulator [Myxococcota bacterium]
MTKHLSETERRNQILRAARAVFIEKGYLAARVEDVAKRASLSKGAVYFYFPSKRDLFMALVQEEHEKTYGFLDQAESDHRPAAVKLLDLGQKYLDYFAGLKSPPRFFLMMSEQGIRDDEIREECQAVHQRFVDAATRILAQGMAEGAFRQGDPQSTAEILKAIIDGMAGQSAIGIRPDRDRLMSDGIQLILYGILAPLPGAVEGLAAEATDGAASSQ